MENQSGHPQFGIADQGFRMMPASSTAQQHVGSSSSYSAVIPETGMHSHTAYGNIDQADDGYLWSMCGRTTTLSTVLFHYQCAQENCHVQKSVTCSIDGQTIQTAYCGSHNHPRRYVRWLEDGSERLVPISQDCVVVDASDAAGAAAAGPSVHGTGNGGDQLSGSSDSEEDDDVNVGVDEDAAAVDANAVKRLRSKVWEEFKPIFIAGKLHKAECKHCQKSLSAKTSGGTKHLRRHLEKHCTATIRGKQKCSAWQPDLPVSKKSKYGHQNPLEEALQKNPLEELIRSMYSSSFAQFLAGRNPVLTMLQQATVEEKFISVFHNEKLKLKEKITATPGGVFLSLEKWMCGYRNGLYFICFTVTAHFIDEDWKINRKTIRCTLVHHSDYFKTVLKNVVRDWVPMKKLLGATLNKPSDFQHALSVYTEATSDSEDELTAERTDYLLPKWKVLIFPCIVHDLHQFMNSNIEETRSTLSHFMTNLSHYMTNCPQRKQKLQEVQSQLPLEPFSFGSQHWYKRFCWYETALQFVKSFPLPEPDSTDTDDLEAAENFCTIARPVYHAIKTLSDYHMTLNSYFHAIWSLRATLQKLLTIENIDRVFNMKGVQSEFDEIWNRWYLWMSIAVVLDPRYKLAFIEDRFQQAFSHDAGEYILEVRAKLDEVYIRYFDANEQSGEILNHRNNAPLQIQSQNHTRYKELSEYLRVEVCPQDESFDILNWWSSNSSAYPTLAKMARDILAIPICAVSSESAFDKSDKRAELFNGRLCPETVEAFICAQDWIKSSGIADADDGNNNTLF